MGQRWRKEEIVYQLVDSEQWLVVSISYRVLR